jgi:hypothetical protein
MVVDGRAIVKAHGVLSGKTSREWLRSGPIHGWGAGTVCALGPTFLGWGALEALAQRHGCGVPGGLKATAEFEGRELSFSLLAGGHGAGRVALGADERRSSNTELLPPEKHETISSNQERGAWSIGRGNSMELTQE